MRARGAFGLIVAAFGVLVAAPLVRVGGTVRANEVLHGSVPGRALHGVVEAGPNMLLLLLICCCCLLLSLFVVVAVAVAAVVAVGGKKFSHSIYNNSRSTALAAVMLI